MIYGTDMEGFATGFVHRKLFKVATGFLTGGPIGAAASLFQKERATTQKFSLPGAAPGGVPHVPHTQVHHLLQHGAGQPAAAAFGAAPAGALPGSCPGVAWVLSTGGRCRNIFTGATMAQTPLGFGPNGAPPPRIPVAGLGPGGAPAIVSPVDPMTFTDSSTIDGVRRRCPRKYVLGENNLCYYNLPRNSKWRKWRPGRKAMFTGGDLNAIATAGRLADSAEDIFKKTNPAKKSVAKNYRAAWRKPLKK